MKIPSKNCFVFGSRMRFVIKLPVVDQRYGFGVGVLVSNDRLSFPGKISEIANNNGVQTVFVEMIGDWNGFAELMSNWLNDCAEINIDLRDVS